MGLPPPAAARTRGRAPAGGVRRSGDRRHGQGWRVLETSHPPVYYLIQEDIRPGALLKAAGGSVCEWKGRAIYFDVLGPMRRAGRAAWSYPNPTSAFAPIAGHVAFYAGPMDACWVGEERAMP